MAVDSQSTPSGSTGQQTEILNSRNIQAAYRDNRSMSDASLRALESIVSVAKTNVDMLLDATTRPEVSAAGVSRASLEILLESLASCARGIIGDSTTPERTSALMQQFVSAYDEYERRTIDVHHHLTALASGWWCGACEATVASDAAVTGVRSGKIEIDLVCAACGVKTPLAKPGKRALAELFGSSMSNAWNPSANGFLWDGK